MIHFVLLVYNIYVYIIYTDENCLGKIGVGIKVFEKRPKCRPEHRWVDMLDGEQCGVSERNKS